MPQQRILEFLADRAATKRLQIVIATHSYHLAERLPQSAIRVLRENAHGQIAVDETISPREALHEIMTLPPGKTVLVEDARVRAILVAELKLQSPLATKEAHVVVRNGGTSRIYADIRAHASARNDDLFVVFDGDQLPKKSIPEQEMLPQGLASLRRLIRELTSGNDTNGPELDFVDVADAIGYIEFLRNNVHYLPGKTPEALVWSDTAARGITGSLPRNVTAEPDLKRRILMLVDETPAFNEDTIFRILLQSFLKSDSSERQQLRRIVAAIRKA
ncbi:MAG TPA: hypothetical protein VIV60_18985 [Polyangiaceae bacterium]